MSLKVCILVKRLSLKLKLAAAQINWHDVSQMQNQSFFFFGNLQTNQQLQLENQCSTDFVVRPWELVNQSFDVVSKLNYQI